jgi:hypothetical protein
VSVAERLREGLPGLLTEVVGGRDVSRIAEIDDEIVGDYMGVRVICAEAGTLTFEDGDSLDSRPGPVVQRPQAAGHLDGGGDGIRGVGEELVIEVER